MRDDRRRELTPRDLHRQRHKEQIARRRLVAALVLLGLIILIIVLVATCGSKDEVTTTTTTGGETTTTALAQTSFTADLIATDTAIDGTGTFTLTYDSANESLAFDLMLDGVNAPRVANIYETGSDGTGTVVYVLYADNTVTGVFTDRLAQGTIDVANLTGSLEGGTIADLVQLIRDGKAYVGVGTKSTPVDAIRGDLLETATSGTGSTDSSGTTDTTGDTSSSDTTDTTG